jgi:hypothetical protein
MHWNDIGSKMVRFGVFSEFSAKGRKVNPRMKSQLVVNPSLNYTYPLHFDDESVGCSLTYFQFINVSR